MGHIIIRRNDRFGKYEYCAWATDQYKPFVQMHEWMVNGRVFEILEYIPNPTRSPSEAVFRWRNHFEQEEVSCTSG